MGAKHRSTLQAISCNQVKLACTAALDCTVTVQSGAAAADCSARFCTSMHMDSIPCKQWT